MVRIIDGEIVQDDDPRLRGFRRPADSATQGGESTTADARRPRGGPGRPSPGWDGASQRGGQPPGRQGPFADIELFGHRISAMLLLGITVGFMLFGWRSLLLGAFLYFVMKNNRARQPPAQQRTGPPAVEQFMQQYMQEQPPRRGDTGQESQQDGSAPVKGSFTGRSFRLGDT
ncbi:unnamed protein product [Ostreobium quekettii]|uniref:DUF4605 domain-containing protein n=1 Tax=Ostreobium quekettii TaxID=121088 RepID=A0A8S1IX29_9CHLO|nr:unnamed protein product [Ostreobium quekettii]|eukprot:evm.model.scf_424.1 EVM.evm.TU.scf_424.1   scf_424:1306-4763(+)